MQVARAAPRPHTFGNHAKARRPNSVIVRAQLLLNDRQKEQVKAATLLAGALVAVQAAVPAEAHAARSGGRVSSSAFGARRAAFGAGPTARAARPAFSRPAYSHTTIVAPTFSPFGFGMPFGGWGLRPAVYMPFPFLSGLLQLALLLLVANLALAFFKGAFGGKGKRGAAQKRDDDGWDSL
jgi:uncharacterized membrane protein